jgi:plastocyanin domain-containing protein
VTALPALPPRPARRGRAGRGGLLIALALIGASMLGVVPLSLLALQRDARSLRGESAGGLVEVSVEADAGRLEPQEIRVRAGASVRVDFRNDDPASPHEFPTAGQYRDAQLVLWPGDRRSIVFIAAQTPGRYGFFCALRGHSEHEFGTIVVT